MDYAGVPPRLTYLNTLKPTHLSLHCDGVRVMLPPNTNIDEICKASSDHIFVALIVYLRL